MNNAFVFSLHSISWADQCQTEEVGTHTDTKVIGYNHLISSKESMTFAARNTFI